MGIYNSPSAALGVLCVKPSRRGSSSAIRFMLTLVAQMFAIVICFKMIVGSLPPRVVYVLFLYGGKFLTDDQLDTFVLGFRSVMWIVFAMQLILAISSLPLTKEAIKMQPNSPPRPTEAYEPDDGDIQAANQEATSVPMQEGVQLAAVGVVAVVAAAVGAIN